MSLLQMRLAALLSVLLSQAAAAATIVFEVPFGPVISNCLPFGCPSQFGDGTYQQVYASTPFPGPVTITGLTFYNRVDDGYGERSQVNPGNYAITLSTTSKQVGHLDTYFPNNIGADNQVFFFGSLGGPFAGDSFTIPGQPFDYDPALGNLLMTVYISDETTPEFATYFDAGVGSGLFSRMTAYVLGDPNPYGLVTGFVFTPIPEPHTFISVLAGLFGLALLRKRH